MKSIVMLGTRFDTMGGISSVVNVYRDAGLFDRNPIVYLATHRDGSIAAKLAILVPALMRFLLMVVAGQVSLVHAHVSSRASFWRKSLFLLPAYWWRVPVILHLHGSEFAVFYEQECSPRQQRFVSRIFDRASRVVTLSEQWQTWVRAMSSNSQVLSIYNPVSLPDQVAPLGQREMGTVLFLGRLGKRKGTYDLLEAAALAVMNVPNLRLLLGGDGELDGIRARARELGIADRVELLGWVRGDEKQRLLDHAMVYALPSYHEGLPMSILEAMAAGLPILSTPIAGIPEAVTSGVEGLLVEPGDVSALANALRMMLTDAVKCRAMGEAARRKIARTFAPAIILPLVESLYVELGARQ